MKWARDHPEPKWGARRNGLGRPAVDTVKISPLPVHRTGGGQRGIRSRDEGDSHTVVARDRDGHSPAIVAVGNTGRCPCFHADDAGPEGRLSARASPLGVVTPDETETCTATLSSALAALGDAHRPISGLEASATAPPP
jgi:hypothetical protein